MASLPTDNRVYNIGCVFLHPQRTLSQTRQLSFIFKMEVGMGSREGVEEAVVMDCMREEFFKKETLLSQKIFSF